MVKEEQAFGFQVTHDITNPDYCLVVDEVVGNINQKGDGNVGGQLQLYKVGTTPQQNISTKDKHYTVLGLTALSGEPVMCIVIFTGIRKNALWVTGLDLEAEVEGSASNDDFLLTIQGRDRDFQWDQHANSKEKTYLASVAGVQKGTLQVKF